ncbi:hypothetical protein D9M69_486400 [compost metagenome]
MGDDDFVGVHPLVDGALVASTWVVVMIEDFVLMPTDGHGIVTADRQLAAVVGILCKIRVVLTAHAHGCTFLGVSVMEKRLSRASNANFSRVLLPQVLNPSVLLRG